MNRNIRRLCSIKKIFFTLFFASCALLQAETFRYQYRDGDAYKIVSTVDERVYVNGQFSHRADILNKISVDVVAVLERSGNLSVQYETSERSFGSISVYEWAESYSSIFWRDETGEYDIEPFYFMPVVRNVPRFPEKDIDPGDTWAAEGEEVHDFRASFGIPRAYHFPITVAYSYLGRTEKDGSEYDLISIGYTIFYKSPAIADSALYPILISGYSEQLLYWDNERGRPYAYTEQFDIIFTLSSGDTVEYIGTAEAKVVESKPLDKEKVAEEIRNRLADSDTTDTQVKVDEKGVTIVLENIQFLPDSSELLSNEKKKLRIIAEVLKDLPDHDVLITGHTAMAGTEAGRQQLSEERARVVGNYLLDIGAKSADQVVTRGAAGREPIADNRSNDGMKRNRRVEITILEK